MKRLLKITLIVTAVVVAALAAWRLTGPHSVGALYDRYAGQPGVRVGYIKDYPFDDSTHVDVTTIEALDDEGWEWMLDEFAGRDEESGERKSLLTLQQDDGYFLFLSYADRSLCLVDARTDRQYDAVLRHQLETLKRTR